MQMDSKWWDLDRNLGLRHYLVTQQPSISVISVAMTSGDTMRIIGGRGEAKQTEEEDEAEEAGRFSLLWSEEANELEWN